MIHLVLEFPEILTTFIITIRNSILLCIQIMDFAYEIRYIDRKYSHVECLEWIRTCVWNNPYLEIIMNLIISNEDYSLVLEKIARYNVEHQNRIGNHELLRRNILSQTHAYLNILTNINADFRHTFTELYIYSPNFSALSNEIFWTQQMK